MTENEKFGSLQIDIVHVRSKYGAWLKVFHFFYNIFWTSALDCNVKIFLVEPSMNNYKSLSSN